MVDPPVKPRRGNPGWLRRTRLVLALVTLAASIYWMREAFTCGRCWFSEHIAPAVIVANLALALVNLIGSRRGRPQG